MGLWRTRTPNFEQIAKLEEDQFDQCGKSGQLVKLEDENHDSSGNSGRLEDGEYILGCDGTRLSKAFCTVLPIHVSGDRLQMYHFHWFLKETFCIFHLLIKHASMFNICHEISCACRR